ncbi:MAG: lysophospholipid acyltransferase family protein [Bdellovibrionota bacterium]
MKWIRAALFFVVVGLTTAYYTLKSLVVYYLGILLNKENLSKAPHEVATQWARSIMFLTPGWRIEVTGSEHLPPDGKAVVIVANHESATDILAMYYLGIQFRWLAKKEVFELPLIGKAMSLAGYVPIDRKDPDSHKEALAKSAEWLSKGIPMFFFPEGTRSDTGKVKKFKRGAFRLANENDVEVLPVCIKGAGRLLKKGTVFPCTAVVFVHILPMMKQRKNESTEEFAGRVQLEVEHCHNSQELS